MGPPRVCWRCREPSTPPPDAGAYAYLLGQYLGDGHLVLTARVPVLRISCADAYPGIMDECEAAMRAVMAKSVQRIHSIGCTYVQGVAKHWPCLLPQAGPGKKHERAIVLMEWQREIVKAHAGQFVRGLIHSDGCRVTNHVTIRGRRYEYPDISSATSLKTSSRFAEKRSICSVSRGDSIGATPSRSPNATQSPL